MRKLPPKPKVKGRPADTARRKVQRVLRANMDKDFVQRISDNKTAPAIINPDGSESTHEMATAEAEGMHYVYPTIMRDERGILKRYHDPADKFAAFREATKRGEAIGFKTQKEAEWFEKNWKRTWNKNLSRRKVNAK